jgi:hypothetical protein
LKGFFMDRRNFIASATGAAAAGILTSLPLAAVAQSAPSAEPGMREYYELRTYRCGSRPRMKLLESFWSDAAIPACGRLGIGPVGVFKAHYGPDGAALFVLLAHPTLESAATATTRLLTDEELRKAGADYLSTKFDNPAYVRVESQLFASFEGMPKLKVPEALKANRNRIFELRTYESHNEVAAKKKIEMFNAGEIAIFEKCGMNPVMFGESLFGNRLPCLVYILAFEDLVARDAAWKTFGAHPDWAKMKSDPQYADLVSNITDELFKPTAYSQV